MRLNWEYLLCTDRERKNTKMPESSTDKRSRYKKDYDTICNSTALRRMQDKAQVFPLEKSDYSRTRLTHSIEVMSIAESIASSAVETILKQEANLSDETRKLVNDIPMLLKSAALLHDMGNPPFGHLGEEIIGKWFKVNLGKIHITDGTAEWHTGGKPKEYLSSILLEQQGKDFIQFEGNAQLLRLITKLSYINDEHGMNLSYALLSTIIKYPISSMQIDKKNHITKKPGYFFSEKDLFNRIETKTQLNGTRHPLTFLLEAADDIAYLTADIEDAQKKGLFTKETIIRALRKKKNDPLIKDILDREKTFEEERKVLAYPDTDGYIVQRMRIYIKGKLIEAVCKSFADNYDKIMEGKYTNELLEERASLALKSVFTRLESEKIYYCKEITSGKIEAYTILNTILERIVMGAINRKDEDFDDLDNLIYSRLSDNYKFVCEQSIKDMIKTDSAPSLILYTKLQLATDYVSGMTDTYAKDFYNMIVANK